MANPNPEIWGAPDTWLNAKTWITNASYNYEDINAGVAKIANFGGSEDMLVGSIRRGITAGKLRFEPIDNTVCPCGQNAAKSAYNSIKMFTNKQDDTLNKIPDKTIERHGAINWCWYYINSAYPQCLHTMTGSGVLNRGEKRCIIAPNPEQGNPLNNNYNPHNLFTPIVYYGIRSIYGEIWVHEDNNSYGGGAWWTLEDWKNNHSSSPIRDVSLGLYGINGRTTTNLNITGVNLSQGEYISATPLMDIDGVTCYPLFSGGSTGVALIVNSIVGNYYDTSTTFHAIGWRDDYENATIKSHTEPNTDRGWCIWLSIPYSATNYEKIMQMCACFAVPFSDSDHSSYPIDFNANYVCLPVINDEGIATGEYTRGADNLTNPFAALDSVRDKDYDPNADYDPNTYSNITGFNSITSGATMTKRYVLDAANVDKLGDDLWTICGQLSSQDFEYFDGKLKDEFLTTNPIDSIISLQRFPFEIPHIGTTKAPIKLGKATATAEGYTTFSPFNSIVFAGKSIFPRFGNCFLDYEPYTSYELYVPFCGTTKIRAADILGHTLNIQMQIDLFTGSCTAYIMADKLVIETMNGSCGVDQTISGAQTATMNANIFNGILNQKAAERQETTTIAKMLYPTGWISAILNPVGGYEKIENAKTQSQIANYEITHLDVPPHKIGAASPLLAWCQEFDARIIIYYPEGDVIQSSTPPSFNTSALQAFGHSKGFGTVTPGTVSSFHGYTQGTIIADQIPCTESERNRIKEAFASGVFLP